MNYRQKRDKERQLQWAISLIQKAQSARAFTTFTIKFEQGEIRQIVEEKSHKPPKD